MATGKDLVEAHSFSRRRLVAAFVSGAAAGPVAETPRAARPVVGGLALAGLLLAAVAVVRVLGGGIGAEPSPASQRPDQVLSSEAASER